MSLVGYKDGDDVRNATIEELEVHERNIQNICKGNICSNCIYHIDKTNTCIYILTELKRRKRR